MEESSMMHRTFSKSRIKGFFKAPVVIFSYYVISYAIFLAIFAWVILFEFKPKLDLIKLLEGLLLGWDISFVLGEYLQV